MSPEQAVGEEIVDARSDIYSLGCVIYEMLAGSPPFAGPTVQALIAKRLAGLPPHLTTVPAPVDEVVRRSLATAPQDRFATAVALADALVEAARKPATPEKSIVVLPFENLSPDPDNAFFADGLTEELIADLSTVGGLRVISRGSAMTFKGTVKKTPEIARDVNVRYVLEGSVRKAGDSLRITAQLIDAESDVHLWSGKYGGTLDDVFEIQEQVAQAIAQALELRLVRGEGGTQDRAPGDARAYECYLRARQELGRPSEEGSRRAIALLEQGLALDSDSPLLLAMKGYAHIFRLRFFLVDDESTDELAAAECVRRLHEVAPDSGHTAFVEAMFRLVVRAEMRDAIAGLERALRQAPSLAEAMFWLSCCYAYIGQPDKASEWGKRLVAVDPLTPFNRLLADCWTCLFRGRLAEAASASRRIYEVDGENVHTVWSHGIHLAYAGLVGELHELVQRLVRLAPDYVYTHQMQALAAAMDGRPGEARSLVSPRLARAARRDAHLALHLAEAFAQMGAWDDALDALDVAVRRGFVDHAFLSEYDTLLAPLRAEARFGELMALARAKQRDITEGLCS
jgi:TolB-like protein